MSQMIIMKIAKERHFTMIPNTMLEDSTLSGRSKGVLCYLLSRPDDWEFHINDLYNKFKDGRDAIYKSITELVEQKYALWLQKRDIKGSFNRSCLFVTDQRDNFPIDKIKGWSIVDKDTDSPDTGKPDTEKPDTVEPDAYQYLSINNTKDTNTKINSNELILRSATQTVNSDSINSVDQQSKHSLIRKGIDQSKEKEISIDKPLNGPYRKVFDYWEMSGLYSPKGKGSTFDKNILALRGLMDGTLLGTKYTIVQTIRAIDNFKLTLSPDYSPTDIRIKETNRKMYFHCFAKNNFNKQNPGLSLFKEMLENPPKLLKDSIKPLPDPNPDITNYLLNSYQQKAMGHANIDFLKDESNKNTFKLANMHLQKFWKANLPNFSYGQIGVNTLAKHLITAFENIVEDKYGGDTTKWELWWFRKEDYIFDVLGKYLYSQSLMR